MTAALPFETLPTIAKQAAREARVLRARKQRKEVEALLHDFETSSHATSATIVAAVRFHALESTADLWSKDSCEQADRDLMKIWEPSRRNLQNSAPERARVFRNAGRGGASRPCGFAAIAMHGYSDAMKVLKSYKRWGNSGEMADKCPFASICLGRASR